MIKQAGINKHFLLFLYLIGLALFLIVLVDTLFLNQTIKSSAIKDSEAFIFLSTVLVLPHIMASNMTLVDKEYFQHYKTPILKAALLGIFVAIISPKIFGITITFLIISVFTMQHVIAQQFGILKSIFSFEANNDFVKWQKYSVIAAILIYIAIYREGYLPERYMILVNLLLYCFISLSAIYAYKLLRYALDKKVNKLCLWYFIANAVLVLLAYFFLVTGYPLFAFLLPRVIHDLSAFTIYIAHDANRNASSNPPNLFYKITNLAKIPPYLACIILSFIFSYMIHMPDNAITVARLITSVTFFHYYIEGIIWKRDGLHRKHVRFA